LLASRALLDLARYRWSTRVSASPANLGIVPELAPSWPWLHFRAPPRPGRMRFRPPLLGFVRVSATPKCLGNPFSHPSVDKLTSVHSSAVLPPCFGSETPISGSCSVLAVSHRLDGFLRSGVAGLLHPAADPGVRGVSYTLDQGFVNDPGHEHASRSAIHTPRRIPLAHSRVASPRSLPSCRSSIAAPAFVASPVSRRSP